MSSKTLFCTVLLMLFVLSSSSQVAEDAKSAKEEGSKSSLVFVFDTTGSMYDDLKQLREGAEMIMDTALEESDVVSNFVFVPFHDPVVGPATVTSNKTEFKAALSRVRVKGGGDCPEKSLGGILMALNVSLPGSYVYVLTDATAGDHGLVGNVLDAVQRKQSQIVFVLTGHCNDLDKPHYKVYQRIAAASSGQVFNLNKTSVHNVLDFVRSSLKGKIVNLGSVVNPAGYNYTQEIPVDNTLSEVTVSVSGAKPEIRVVDPQGQQITGPPKLITTLDLSEIMVVKVVQPVPGNWSITVGSEEDYSVRVVGQSNLTFRHGFSVNKPGSATETSHRPLQGTHNYMLITLTDADNPVKISHAEILSLEGRTLFEVPLREIREGTRLYLADAFIPPEDFFYIAINGRDEYNQELRRVGATAIQAKLPDPPYITAPQSLTGHMHESLTISCRVESLVPVTVSWVKDAKRQKTSSLQSTVLDYVIKDLNQDSAGSYRCVAKNNAGVSTAVTEVKVIVDPPQMTLTPNEAAAFVGDHINVSCSVFSETNLLKFLLIAPGNESVTDLHMGMQPDGYYAYKNIIEVDENSAGVYTCKAANAGGETNSTMKLKVQSRPQVSILGPRTLAAHLQARIRLVCDIEGADTMLWLAPNGSEVQSDHLFGRHLSHLSVNVSLIDEGYWTCVGMCKSGFEARDSVYLNVTIKPVVKIDRLSNLTLPYGSDFDLTCTALAKPSPTILQWSKDNRDIYNTTRQNLQPNLYSAVLKLRNITEASEGNYSCYAKNGIGSSSESLKIAVRRNMSLIRGFTDRYVQLYSQVTLNCNVDSYPEAQIDWYHNGTKIIPNENGQLASYDSAVHINKVDFSQLGEFVCIASNKYEQLVINGTLTVDDLESPLLLKEPLHIKTREGNSTVIPCSLLKGKPYPEIFWQFKAVTSDKFTDIPEGFDLREDKLGLSIPNVDKAHAGIYRCIAENALGRDAHECLLEVQYPPVLTNSLVLTKEYFNNQTGHIEVKSGEKVTLRCRATGVPTPLFVWTKDNKPVTFTKNIYLNNASELVLAKAMEYDSGIFTCTAISALGSVQRNFTVFVFEPPTIFPSEISQELNIIEGQLVELPCLSRGVPTPTLQWQHNGGVIKDGDRKYIDDDFVLRFVANLTDFGEYTCLAENLFGNASCTYHLYIWVPPYIEPPHNMEVDTVLGRDVSLNCSAIGFPVPSIRWEFEQRPLTVNTSDLTYNVIGNLFIRNSSAQHNGHYTCVAENDVGIAMKTISLDVSEPPVIEPDSFTGPYVATDADSSLNLPCKASGKPKPFVAWSKDGFYIDRDGRYSITSDGSLTIEFPAEELSGEYVCFAKNKAGVANSSIEVQIYSLPRVMQSDQPLLTLIATEGTNYSLQCPVRVTRNFTVKWYKNGTPLPSSLLANISRNNASTYSCSVSNAVGVAHASVILDVQWPPRFLTQEQPLIEVLKGDSYEFECGVDAKPNAQMKWLFNSRPIVGEDKDRLRLTNIQLHHIGVYKCIMNNVLGTVVRQFTLDVLVPPFVSDFDFLEIQLKEGTNATLACKATGLPTPTTSWIHNNSNWHQQSSSLNVYNASSDSQGIFRCNAQNKAGKTHLLYKVTVVSPAKVTEMVVYDGSRGSTILDDVELLLNSKARIACHASGTPAPRIQWLNNGNSLSENVAEISYADLVFHAILSTQAGVYRCVASNEGGADEKKVKIRVLEPPQISTSLFQPPTLNNFKSLEILSGQPFRLHCHVYGDPLPQIQWYKDGDRINLDGKEVRVKGTELGETLTVEKAVYGQSGNYTCVAKNKVGQTSFSYLVSVLVPPLSAPSEPIPVRVRQGSPLRLQCPVTGSPAPTVAWVKHPFIEINSMEPDVYLSEDNDTLTINATETTDSGKYTCTMANKVGVTEYSYSVSVEKEPSSGEETTVTSLHRSIVLYCHADGYPTPLVYWYKDGKILTLSNNVQLVLEGNILTIWRTEPHDAGLYICVAENSAGVGYRKNHLQIIVPGQWSPWSPWSLCNATCGLGHQVRYRSCRFTDGDVTVDAADNTTSDRWTLDQSSCKGAKVDRRKCNMPACEESESKAQWSGWSRWSACSASCGVGAQTRSRRCRPAGGQCRGDNVQIRKCPDLQSCHSSGLSGSENDLLNNSREELAEPNPFTPEATFELEPEVGPNYPEVDPNYHEGNSSYPEAEEFEATKALPSKVFSVVLTENLHAADDGPCGVGFKFINNTGTCEDIDECLIENNHCHSTQLCQNTNGGYRCSCQPGYVALGVGQRCLDINECEQGLDGCQYACVNVAGGFVCACPKHLRLSSDRRRCVNASSYGKYMEQLQDYLSATVDFPGRFMRHGRN